MLSRLLPRARAILERMEHASSQKSLREQHDDLASEYCKLTIAKAAELEDAEAQMSELQKKFEALETQHSELRAKHIANLEDRNMSTTKYEKQLSSKDAQIEHLLVQYDDLFGNFHCNREHVSPGRALLKTYIDRMSSFLFLELPAELRNEVYRLVLVLDHPLDLWPLNRLALELSSAPSKPTVPSRNEIVQKQLSNIDVRLLRVSKQVHKEAVGIFYGENAFQFSDVKPYVPLTVFLRHIGRNCRFLTSISVHISDISGDSFVDWGQYETMKGYLKTAGEDMTEVCKRFTNVHYNTFAGPSWAEETWSVYEGERIIAKLPALKHFTVLVPHCVKIHALSAVLTDDATRDHIDYEENYKEKERFAAVEASGGKVEKCVVLIRRHQTHPMTSNQLIVSYNMDDDRRMGRDKYVRQKTQFNWNIKTASYSMQPDGPAIVMDEAPEKA